MVKKGNKTERYSSVNVINQLNEFIKCRKVFMFDLKALSLFHTYIYILIYIYINIYILQSDVCHDKFI